MNTIYTIWYILTDLLVNGIFTISSICAIRVALHKIKHFEEENPVYTENITGSHQWSIPSASVSHVLSS